MNYPWAIVLAAVILGAAIVAASHPAVFRSEGPYRIAIGHHDGGLWRINTITGALDYCQSAPDGPKCQSAPAALPTP